ncbi:hypothetical protein L873DRAFT_1854464 [Choiromyces venosus 120613-1]|uniref:Myb/SANT-like domain-containing protein n=1 Tax=Choiromyces venosus 120613-1 TaxID=1336337 RepID=A0A3N4J577_9PEZI|nr:hypothetical protein L873DRAFT_1854464 [Choiromyces venosus 120613-1]
MTSTISEEQQKDPKGSGKAAKWAGWMDQALVRQVIATDPINCGRGKTAAKWGEVSNVLKNLKPQPILHSGESCRQRVKRLVEIYKKAELASLKKTGTDEEFGEFELNMVEIAARWDQCSTDPDIRKLVQQKAMQLEMDGKRVRDDSMQGLVRQWEEGTEASDIVEEETPCSTPAKKKQKNNSVKEVDKVLHELTEGMKRDEEELKEIERKQNEKHEDLMRGILSLAEEIQEQSECRSHDAFLEREAWKDELILILEALRRDHEI